MSDRCSSSDRVTSQIAHGAQAMMICEPAACKAYISPRQIRSGSQIFEKLVMGPNLRVKALLDSANCDLIFHDCGELTPITVAPASVNAS